MPRKTPVRELEMEENAEGSLRRSSRIAQGSPAPAKIPQRRNSSSSDTPAKITKGRRLSLSQENNSESTENKTQSQTNVTDAPKKTRLTRSASKSPTILAKDLETKITTARTRTRRGSKSIEEEDTPNEPSSQKSKGRSNRSESKSPITVKDVEPAKARTRRGSITEKIAILEKIEETHQSPPEPKKRIRSRRSSLTEMEVIEETDVNKKELKKSGLETISETKENDEKDKSIILSSPESKDKTKVAQENSNAKQDKFKMSPVVVIQKSKTIIHLTTEPNSEKDSVAGGKETKDDEPEKKEANEKTDSKSSLVIIPELKEGENQNSDIKKESKAVAKKNAKDKEEVSVTSSNSESSTNSSNAMNKIKNTDPKKTDESTIDKNKKPKEEFPATSNNLEPSTSSDNTVEKTQHSGFMEKDVSVPDRNTQAEKECPIIANDLVSSTNIDSTKKKIESVSKENVEKSPTDKNKKQDIDKKNEKLHNQSKDEFAHNASNTTEKNVSLDILLSDKKQTDEINKLNLDEKEQCMTRKLTPEDEVIIKNIDSVLKNDTSTEYIGQKKMSKTNKPELDKVKASSENVLNITEQNKDSDIDVDEIEVDILTNKFSNENNQSTPVNNDKLKKATILTSGKKLSKNCNKEDSKITTSQEDLNNKSLSCLLTNQVEMISGSDGSFNINLSLEHIQGSSSQEELSECKHSKEKSINDSEDELNKSNSSNKENITNEQNKIDMPESNEKNTSLSNLSLKDIEKHPDMLKSQLDNSFCEPMDVDDPSLLHIDDVITANKRRSVNIEESLSSPNKKMFKLSKKNDDSPKKESASILNTEENIRISKIDICKTPAGQIGVIENEQTANKCDISKEDLNVSETKSLSLGESELNKIDDSNLKKTDDTNQIQLEKASLEQTELTTAESDNNESGKVVSQRQPPDSIDDALENIQDISDVSDLVNKSVSAEDKVVEKECVSPALSINSADITDKNDEDDIPKTTPKKQNVGKFTAHPSDTKDVPPENNDINEQSKNSIEITEMVCVEDQTIQNNIVEVEVRPAIGIKIDSDKINNEKEMVIAETVTEKDGEEIEQSAIKELQNETSKPLEDSIEEINNTHSKDYTNSPKTIELSILNTEENIEISKIDICKTPANQVEVTENKQTANKCDISKEGLNVSETKSLSLGENDLNKADDSNLKKTGDTNQIQLEEASLKQTKLSTAETDNNESGKVISQRQQTESIDSALENIQDISDGSDFVNKSLSAEDKVTERKCISPTFSINSADITDENDEDDIPKTTPKKQNVGKHITHPYDTKNISPDNKYINEQSENSVENQTIEDNIVEVENSPVIKEIRIADTETAISIKIDSDKINEKEIVIAKAVLEKEGEEIEQLAIRELQNETSKPLEDSIEEINNTHSKDYTNSPKTIELENNDTEPRTLDIQTNPLMEKSPETNEKELSNEIKLVNNKSITKSDISDKGTEQVPSTTSNEIKSKQFEADSILETMNNTAENNGNVMVEGSSNEDINKDLSYSKNDKLESESNRDDSSQKDIKSNITLLTNKKKSHEDQPEDTANISPKERKLKPAKSKSKKKNKLDTSEPVEIYDSTEETNEKDGSESIKKKKKKMKASKSSQETFDEKVESFIEETMKEFGLSSEDENYDEDSNVFIDDIAEEGEEDTPSEGSNDIPCDGESIDSSDTYTEDDDEDSYEADSFIDDDEDKGELLSGEENFLQDEKAVARPKPISPGKEKKKRQRIITVSDSDDESHTSQVEVNEEKKAMETADNKEAQQEDAQIDTKLVEKNKVEKSKEDSSENSISSNTKTVDVDIPTDFLPSHNDIIHVDSDSSSAVMSDSVNEFESNKNRNNSVAENRSRKSSITIQENIKLEDIEDGELSDRISKVVDWFYTGIRNNSDVGNISLNVSLDYAGLTPNEENAVKVDDSNVNLERNKQSKKRKSDDFIANESPKKATYETIPDEVFAGASKDNIEFGKLSKKSKRKSLQKENQEDEKNAKCISLQNKLTPRKPKKKNSEKLKVENQLMLDSKLGSKRLSDDKINYLLPKRVRRGVDKAYKTATLEDSSNVIKDITSTINKNENIENNTYEEIVNEDEVSETSLIKVKPKKTKKNKKADRISNDIGNVITETVKSNDLTRPKKKKTKKIKEVRITDEDNTNMNNDFHSVSNKKVDKYTTLSRNIPELKNEFNVEVENKKIKKLKRLSYPTRKTEIPCSSGVLKQQFISSTITSKSEVAQKREKRRKIKQAISQKILPSKTTNLDDSWESEIFDISLHPSKSNRKPIDAGPSKKKKTEIETFSSKDFKNKMLYDANRIKRMATKVLLRQRKGF